MANSLDTRAVVALRIAEALNLPILAHKVSHVDIKFKVGEEDRILCLGLRRSPCPAMLVLFAGYVQGLMCDQGWEYEVSILGAPGKMRSITFARPGPGGLWAFSTQCTTHYDPTDQVDRAWAILRAIDDAVRVGVDEG